MKKEHPMPTLLQRTSYVVTRALAALVLFQGAAHLLSAFESSHYAIWADRDLTRALHLPREFQWLGPEFTGGGRVPGGAYYYLLYAIQLFGKSPEWVHAAMLLFFLGAVIYLAFVIKRSIGPLAAVATAAKLLLSTYLWHQLNQIWNPGFGLSFILLAYAFLAQILLEKKETKLPLLVGSLGVASQIHLSYALLLPIFALVFFVEKVTFSKSSKVRSAALLLILYSPYLWFEGQNHFHDLTEWFHYSLPVFANIPGDSGTSVEAANGWHLFQHYARPLAAMTALIMFFPLVYWGGHRKTLFSPTNEKLCRGLFWTLIFGAAFIVPWRAYFRARYGIFLYPALVLLMACYAQAFWDKRTNQKLALPWRAVILVALAFALSYRPIVPKPVQAISLHPLGKIRAVLTALSNFKLSPFNTVVLRPFHEKWTSIDERHRAVDYLVRESNFPSLLDSRCALVLLHSPQSQITEAHWKKAKEALPISPPTTDWKKEISAKEFDLYSYLTADGNCFRNLANAYLSLPEENAASADLEKTLTVAPAGLQKRPFTLKVEVRVTGNQVQAFLSSPYLRGYDGIQMFRVWNPSLILRQGQSASVLPIYDGVLGAELTLAPWHSTARSYPSGRYEIALRIENSGQKEFALGSILLPQFKLSDR